MRRCSPSRSSRRRVRSSARNCRRIATASRRKSGGRRSRSAIIILAMPRPILPGSTVGVLGGGQLGRMFAMAARRLGYRVHTLAPEHDTPTGQIADVEIVASYDDVDRIREFARGVDVVTFEFENVSSAGARAATECAIVRPSPRALEIAQH